MLYDVNIKKGLPIGKPFNIMDLNPPSNPPVTNIF